MQFHRACALGLLLSLPAIGASVPRSRRVLDVAPTQLPSGSAAAGFASVGGVTLFAATDATHGRELWRSDGTAAGTFLLEDITPLAGSSNPGSFTVVGSLVFFVASSPTIGTELWRSDGTAAGTYALDLNPGAASSAPKLLTAFGSKLAFAANDGTNGQELMMWDGTAASATVYPLKSGTAGQVLDLEVVGSKLFVSADGGTTGTELYVSSGGAPTQVMDIVVGSGGSAPRELTAVGTKLYFTAVTPSTSNLRQVWVSDGTSANTKVAWSAPTGVDALPTNLTAFGSQVVFTASVAPYEDLMVTDGTTPARLARVDASSCVYFCFDQLLATPAGLFFTESDPSVGIELFHSDGTLAGTGQVADLWPGAPSSEPMWPTWFQGALYFTADDGVHGRELWRSDGTSAGTTLAADLFPGSEPSDPSWLVPLDARLWMSARDRLAGDELWVSDGTSVGSQLVADVNPGSGPRSSEPRELLTVGSITYFVASSEGLGFELWRTDGTAAGTRLVRDISPGAYSSSPQHLFAFRGRVFFSAETPDRGRELWMSDGTETGTTQVADLAPGLASSDPNHFVAIGDALYFSITVGGAGRVVQLPPGSSSPAVVAPVDPGWLVIHHLVAVGSRLFAIIETATERALYTTAGAAPLARVPSSPAFKGVRAVTPAVSGSKLFFIATADTTSNWEPWVADESSVTELPIRAGTGSSNPDQLFAIGDRVYLSANDGVSGNELYVYAAGMATPTLLEIAAGAAEAKPTAFASLGGELYFTASSGGTQLELWRSDGTSAGTTRVANVAPAGMGTLVDSKLALDGRLYYWVTASDGSHDLWVFEPSTGRNVQRAELGAVTPSWPSSGLTLGASAFFFAGEEGGDVELHAVDRDFTPPVITPALAGPRGNGDWFLGDVGVSFGASDPESDGLVSLIDCAPGAVLEDTRGQTFHCTASSEGGIGEVSVIVRRDSVAPSLRCEAHAEGTALDAGGVPVALGAVATDALDPAPPTLIVTRSDGAAAEASYPLGTTDVSVVAEDSAGNRSAPCAISVDVVPAPSHYGLSCASAGGGEPLSWLGGLALLALFTRRRRQAAGLGLIAIALLAGSSVEAAPKLKLAFTGISAGPGADKGAAKALSDSFESELSALGLYQVISPNLVATLIGQERQRQLLGCDESEASASCMAEIAGALDGDRLISGELSRVGDSWILNASLIDGRKAKLLHRAGRSARGDSVEPLLEELRPLIYELVNVEPALAGHPLRLPRRFGGLVVGLRGDADLLGPGFSAAPSATVEYSGRHFGGALTVIAQARPGVRIEGRFYPLVLGQVRPYLALGGTGFPTGLAARGAAGVAVKFDRLQLFADLGYERFLVPLSTRTYLPQALVFGVGAGWGL